MPQGIFGLSQSEVVKRLEKYGPNQIKESTKNGPLKILLRQIKGNFIIYLLVISAVISYTIGKSETMYTLFVVVIVVVVLLVLSFLQDAINTDKNNTPVHVRR